MTDPTDADREEARKALCFDCRSDVPLLREGWHRAHDSGQNIACRAYPPSEVEHVAEALATACRQERERLMVGVRALLERYAGPEYALPMAEIRRELDRLEVNYG